MTQQEILEGNLLIADFMGIDEFVKSTFLVDGSSVLTYNSSWGALMPVVEKIERIGYEVWIKANSCWIYGYPETEITHIMDNPKIEAVWLAVVEFIKWYNKKK